MMWLLVAALMLPVHGHTRAAVTEWKGQWARAVLADGGLTVDSLTEYWEFEERHPRRVVWSVEQWRPLVEHYFDAADVGWAMRVMACESQGDPNAKNPSSSASGLFQHLARFWPERSVKAGWAGSSVFDPEANVAVAAWLYYTGGAGHWVCK